MSIFSGKQKAWVALVMPGLVTIVFALIEGGAGHPIDPVVKTTVVSILTSLGVYQVANRT